MFFNRPLCAPTGQLVYQHLPEMREVRTWYSYSPPPPSWEGRSCRSGKGVDGDPLAAELHAVTRRTAAEHSREMTGAA